MRPTWRVALGFGLSAALLYWALHDQHWAEVAEALRGSSIPLWGAAIIVSVTIFPLRARRWRPILDPVAPGLPFSSLWRGVAVGMAANNVLPGRFGEVVRASVLARAEPRVPFSAALTSLVVDRTFDALIVLLMLIVAVLDPRFGTGANVGNTTVSAILLGTGAVVTGAFLVLYAAVFLPHRLEGLAAAVTRRIAPRWEVRVRRVVQGFAAGLGVLRDPRRLVSVIAWTVLHWLVNAAAFWIGFRALGIDVPVSAALFVQGLIAIGVAIPSMPGFFGPFELAAIASLRLYGVSEAQAASWAIAYHILTLIPITVIGAWYVARLGITWGELRRTPPPRAEG